jgi:glycerate 2-kinase
MKVAMVSKLVSDATAISGQWLREMDLRGLVEERLSSTGMTDADVDVVAIGKAAREMSDAVSSILGIRVMRSLVICDRESAAREPRADHVVVGEHPVPGSGSMEAGRRLFAFLDDSSNARCTLFLISGGASSLCVVPEPPLELAHLASVWAAALASGVDITTLNKVRAATSQIAGGSVLRRVRTEQSLSLIMVDNVVSGPEWVASAMTYDYAPGSDEMATLLAQLKLSESGLGGELLEASRRHNEAMAAPTGGRHENIVVVEPSTVLTHARDEARRRGYRVVEMGSQVHGDVSEVSAEWGAVLRIESVRGDPICILGVGEVTVRVRGAGLGGRCQEFAWTAAGVLAQFDRPSAFVARSSDGRDFIQGVGGAWVDGLTQERAAREGIDWAQVLEQNDTYHALHAIGQLIAGGHTGWNLCDVYVGLM